MTSPLLARFTLTSLSVAYTSSHVIHPDMAPRTHLAMVVPTNAQELQGRPDLAVHRGGGLHKALAVGCGIGSGEEHELPTKVHER